MSIQPQKVGPQVLAKFPARLNDSQKPLEETV